MIKNLFMDGRFPVLGGCGIKDVEKGIGYVLQMHHHPDSTEILLMVDGEGSIEIKGVNYAIAPQSVVIYNQGVWHEENLLPSRPVKMLYFNCAGIQVPGLEPGMLVTANEPCVYTLSIEKFATLEQLFITMNELKYSLETAAHAAANHLLAAILMLLLRDSTHESVGVTNHSAQAAETAKHYIEERYAEKLTLQLISEKCYLSTFHLSRTFKACYGISPMKYLSNYRIEAAKHFLQTTSDTVGHISAKVGCESVTHFQSVFKKTVGITPSNYRRKGVALIHGR
ncbi:AraC family transcriptional regulator [Paenibacillus psychroresistens]|uniref:AraC family transcriptional regulator n=1 Tax=Paenibacillus psychroresistens TaxID=1778678 RepID=UPI0013911DAB|nr:AraC family transcriptional regulator [Paenibacillus psychroresistens]